jgi:hypothetical protein
MLLVDYFLSKKSAQSYSKFFYGTPRSDVESKFSLPPDMDRFYASQLPEYEKKIDDWRKLMLKITQG